MEFTTSTLNQQDLPLVIEPKKKMSLAEFKELLKHHQNFFKEKLLNYGGLLFRGFPIHDEHDFAVLIEELNLGKFMNYIGGDSPRIKIREGIYTSTEAPPNIKIPLHNEFSFVNKHPKHIYFYCHIAPQVRGETIIGDARKIYHSMDKSVRERFETKGLKYVSRYHHNSAIFRFITKNSHKSWIDVFETADKMEVERLCQENDFQMKWNKNEWLEVSQIRPSTITHPNTQENIWFNQAHLYDFNPKFLGWFRYLGTKIAYSQKHTKLHDVLFADETAIPKKDLYHVMDTLDQHTIAFPWQKGDVMVLDNILTMHGREVFSGKRRVLTALTS